MLVDLLFFGLLFVSFARARLKDPRGFDQAQDRLVTGIGFANLLILLTSSWLVAVAVRCARHGEVQVARRLLIAAVASGTAFVVLKGLEYYLDVSAGAGFVSQRFFTYYFVLTGLHCLHVIVGTLVLAKLADGSTQRSDGSGNVTRLETGATFWHLVDLLWVVIFPTLYLAR